MIARLIAITGVAWVLSLSPVDAASAPAPTPVPIDARLKAELLPVRLANDYTQRRGSLEPADMDGLNAALFALNVDADSLPLRLIVDLACDDAEAGSFDPYLRLLNADGSQRYANDDAMPNTRDARLDVVLTHLNAMETLYIGVSDARNPHYDVTRPGSGRAVAAHGSYTLTVRTESVAGYPDSFEPNDTIEDATFMGNGSFSVTWEDANISSELDVDIYKISLAGPAVVRAQVNPDWSDYPFDDDNPADPVLRLRNCTTPHADPDRPDPCDLGSADDTGDLGTGASVSTVVYEPQDLYIMISGSPNRAYDPTVAESGVPGSSGTYALNVDVMLFDPGGPYEPNDSIPTAAFIPGLTDGRLDQFDIDGYLGDGMFRLTRGDRDFYEFEVTGGAEAVEIRLAPVFNAGSSRLQAAVTVFDREGTEIARGEANPENGYLWLTVPAWCAGFDEVRDSLFVMVRAVDLPPPDDVFYPIPDGPTTVPDYGGAGSVGAYRLTFRTGFTEPNLAVEPNDTIYTAMPTGMVNEGVYVAASYMGDSDCEPGGYEYDDVDMWSLVVTDPPVWLTARVSVCDGSGYFGARGNGYSLRLFDAGGEELALHPVDFLDCTAESTTFKTLLTASGTYYLGVADGWSCRYSATYDPRLPCTHDGDSEGPYHISMSLAPTPGRHTQCTDVRLTASEAYGEEGLYLGMADLLAQVVVYLDAVTDPFFEPLYVPVLLGSGWEGLTSDGENRYFMEGRRFPRIHRRDLVASNDHDEYRTWFGSGYYSDVAALGGKLFLLDYMENAIHVMDARNGEFLCTMPVGATNGISLSGGLAALAGPNRLYAADAFNTRNIYEISTTGAVTDVLTPMTKRPVALGAIGTDGAAAGGDRAILAVGEWDENGLDVFDRRGNLLDALDLPFSVASCGGNGAISTRLDFDADGDLDLVDVALLQDCFGVSDCGHVTLSHVSLFAAAMTGP